MPPLWIRAIAKNYCPILPALTLPANPYRKRLRHHKGDQIMGFYPIMCDLDKIPVILVGRGAEITRRLRLIDEASAQNITVYSDDPSPALRLAAAARAD